MINNCFFPARVAGAQVDRAREHCLEPDTFVINQFSTNIRMRARIIKACTFGGLDFAPEGGHD